MSHQTAQQEAVRLAVAGLAGIDVNRRCQNAGLPRPDASGVITFRAFGETVQLDTVRFELTLAQTGLPAPNVDRILILHSLLCDAPLSGSTELISFRNISGGQFYWEPFVARAIRPLIGKFGNDMDGLRRNMDRFDWEPYPVGDFGARIRCFGNIAVTLVYRRGDEEFPATADILFDAGLRRVFHAEDVATLAARVCARLIR